MSAHVRYEVAEMTPEWWAAVYEIMKPNTRKVPVRCKKDGTLARKNWKYCPQCGKKFPTEPKEGKS